MFFDCGELGHIKKYCPTNVDNGKMENEPELEEQEDGIPMTDRTRIRK